jgi:predicted nucleotidyltransferase
MWYPIPKNGNAFAYCSKLSVDKKWNGEFSRNEKSEYLDEYISYINKWWWIFSYLPFVKEIYLANSITFNSLSSESDIDLFVVCKRGRVWTSRLLVSFLMMFFWIKRSKKDYIKKFCLSFFVDEDNENLKSIMLWSKDVYLANSIVFNAVNDSSDVDLFVVSKRNRIWISRLVMSLVFLFLWIKRTTNSSSKKFCLSFFVDEEHQDLSGLSLW